MEICYDMTTWLSAELSRIGQQIPDLGDDFDPLVRVADPRFGDLQANGILPYAKKLAKNPRELAQQLLDAVLASGSLDADWVKMELAGPGFLNFAFTPAFRMEWLRKYAEKEVFLSQAAEGRYREKKVVIDFSSPNTAKRMHVGHIRSTVIGDVIARILAFSGADTVRDNHIGDWGTQFGLLILAIKESGFDLHADHADIVGELEGLYRESNAKAKEDEAYKDAARSELVRLQEGEPENRKLWERICEVSMHCFDTAYDRLGVGFDETLGESFYCDKVDRIYSELKEDGIAEESEGALVVFHPEHKRFSKQPFIVRKRDGASNYATTDLATVLYRVEHHKADEIVYVTDNRQIDHFEQLFLTVEKWFEKRGYPMPKLTHITFGTIQGEDGKAIKTRSGEPVRLDQLLDEAVERSQAIVDTKNPEFPEEERVMIAKQVGIGALRYADLMQHRSSNYKFSWDKMLSFEGNTAPYLLYAVARIYSIFRKAELEPGQGEEEASCFETEGECELARKLMQFPVIMEQSLSEYCPHFVCGYLYELADAYSTFYNANRVVLDEAPIQARRLMLCARTLTVMEIGLELLGIKSLERM